VRAVKLYADGALGSRGAALIEPYSDDPGNRGLTLTSSDALRAAALHCLDRGFQLCVHAIGDRANDVVLSVYGRVFAERKIDGAGARFRIEHAQVLDSSAIPEFHRLGILPMMQPTHCTSDMPWAEQRLGPERVRRAYAWRSLLDQGSIIPASSDAPVESPNPLWGFYAAITRQDREGRPEGGWHPEQRMTRPEALKAFTLWGAYAGFQERTEGSIEPGKWADLVVLSDDVMKIEPRKILDTRVEMTIIGGSVAFGGGAFAQLAGTAEKVPGQ
jgi:predicted amidohydrolase YtcJ